MFSYVFISVDDVLGVHMQGYVGSLSLQPLEEED